MWPRVRGMRAFGMGPPGEMRDRLTQLTLSGTKTATAGLWKDEYETEGEEVEQVGERQVLLDSSDVPIAIVEITRVERHPFVEVPWEFAAAEGEGFRSTEHWREGHRSFYGSHGVSVADDDDVICVWFRVVEAPVQI